MKLSSSYNIYCDESRVENPDSKTMVIGALVVPRHQRRIIAKSIRSIFRTYEFNQELKWSKVSGRYIEMYRELIEFFNKESSLQYRFIAIDKTKIKYDAYHQGDAELAFFKFYYYLLRPKLLESNNYFISLDKKPTRDKNRARALKSYLAAYSLNIKASSSVKHLQAYDSSQSVLVQLADFLTGMAAYQLNEEGRRPSMKEEVSNYLLELIQKNDLKHSTPLSESKFNIFIWDSKR